MKFKKDRIYQTNRGPMRFTGVSGKEWEVVN